MTFHCFWADFWALRPEYSNDFEAFRGFSLLLGWVLGAAP